MAATAQERLKISGPGRLEMRSKLVHLPRAARYLVAVAFVAAMTLVVGLAPISVSLAQRSPLYLLAVLAAGALLGRGAAVLAAVLSFLAFDFFFVHPVRTFTVADPAEWQALLLFLAAALVTGELTAQLRRRAEVATQREREALAVYEIGRAVSAATSVEDAVRDTTASLRRTLGLTQCEVLVPDGALQASVRPDLVAGAGSEPVERPVPSPVEGPVLGEVEGRAGHLRASDGRSLDPGELAVASWVMTHRVPASQAWMRASRRLVRVRLPGRSTGGPVAPGDPRLDRAAGSGTPGGQSVRGVIYLPLAVQDRALGVLRAVAGDRRGLFSESDMRLLLAAADRLALALDRARLERETVQTEVLRRTDQLRAGLLSAVSHDFRTPLAAIKAAAGSLTQDGLAGGAEAQRASAAAAQIEREADRLNRLVENLLDLSRIESGALKLDRQWYPLRELVEDTVRRLAAPLAAHHVEVAVPADLPPVPLDYVLIQQVLVNLLENAAKYSPEHTTVRIAAAHDPGDAAIRVRIEDEGPGLPPEDSARIFTPFYRVTRTAGAGPRPAAETPHGAGYGLAVCAGFVAAHGGRIWAEQVLDRGAAFVFTLPLEAAPFEAPPEASPPEAPPEAPSKPYK